ncbi:MAG: zinc-binding alcohol dehydrogenase [Pseudorhodoplanes sp.]
MVAESNAAPAGSRAEALWYVGPGKAEIRSEKLGSGAVRVRTLCSGLSRGTERLVFRGHVPESEFGRMGCPHMGGQFPYPVKYGYAAVGRVEDGEWIGRTVFALHPHQTAFALPRDALTPVPENVPPARAVLAANMETALNAVWDAAPGPADRITVIGAGVVGALTAYLCGRLPGAQVTLVDTDAARGRTAKALNVAFATPDDAPDDCDVVFHASGQAGGLATALRIAGMEATVAEMSWYGAGDVAAPLGGAFHSRRLKLVSSQVGQVAPSHRARWTHRRRLQAALHLLADPALDALLGAPTDFHDLPKALPKIFETKNDGLCPLVRYP